MKNIKKWVALSVLLTASTAFAAEKNFVCPEPYEIQVTDFTKPNVWVAQPVAHSVPGQLGVGLGGGKPVSFIKAKEAEVNHKKGWVCVYKAENDSIHYYQTKMLQFAESNSILRKKYKARMLEEFRNAEPYLKDFSMEEPLGFVGFQSK